ncbi:hypothetical protein ABIB86_000472 [Bradyrhizobium sp. JR1.7]|uniref:hypothetical protein n=1 Tax=unclassified Bradyrhizobium TaxID=2631580 RepID=UPI003396F7F5
MIVTEEEAKTKRCQESFAAATGLSADGHAYATSWHSLPPYASGGAGHAVYTAPQMCIGSACMAWRWGKVINVYKPCDPETNNAASFTVHEELGGYCGKGGIPVQVGMVAKP